MPETLAGGGGQETGPAVPVMDGPLGRRSRPRAAAGRHCGIGPSIPGR